jgi:hypothetical protein
LEKEGKALKDQDKRDSSQKDEVVKTGWSSFGFWGPIFLEQLEFD